MANPTNVAAAAAGNAAGAGIPPTFNFEPFDRTKTKWGRWVKRLEGAMRLFGVNNNVMQSVLLHYMGSETYNILADNVSPDEPENQTYQQIVDVLGNYYDPEPLEMVELWKFRSRTQMEGESIAEFITALQREAKYCKFGDYLQNALRNQLVFGLRNQRIRSRLIEEKALTFDKAKDISLAMEASGEGAEVLNRKLHELNLIDNSAHHQRSSTSKVTNNTNKTCYRCGSETHLANVCRHKDTVCGFCRKKGHLQRVCLSTPPDSKFKKDDNKKLKTHLVEEEGENDSDSGDETIDEICVIDVCNCNVSHENKPLSKIYIQLKVNQSLMRFEVDSGSPVSLVSATDRAKYLTNLPLNQTNTKLRSYCGGQIKVHGTVDADVVYKGKVETLRLFVVDSNRHPLLGREWMRALQLNWNEILAGSVLSIKSLFVHHCQIP